MEFGTYCGTEIVKYISQVKYDQLAYFKDLTEADYDGWLEGTLIPSAERFIDGYVNHSFGTPSFGTLNLDGSGKRTLWMPPPHAPMIGISGGSIDSVGLILSDLAIYDQYIRYSSNFPHGRQNVVLFGSWGYLDKDREPIVPADISNVCAQLCSNMILDMVRRNMAPDLFQAIMAGGDTAGAGIRTLWAQPAILTAPLKDLLDDYRILWVDVG